MKYIAYMVTENNPRPKMIMIGSDRRKLMDTIKTKAEKMPDWYICNKGWVPAKENNPNPGYMDDRVCLEISQAFYAKNPFNYEGSRDMMSQTAWIYIDDVMDEI